MSTPKKRKMSVCVDVIVPVHNAETTIEETVNSAMRQCIPSSLQMKEIDVDTQIYSDSYGRCSLQHVHIDIAVCCYDDGSTDESFQILTTLKERFEQQGDRHTRLKNDVDNEKDSSTSTDNHEQKAMIPYESNITTRLLIHRSTDGIGRGAGYARNRAACLRSTQTGQADANMTSQSNHTDDISASRSFICLLDSDDIMHKNRIAEQLSVMLHLSASERNSTILGCTFTRIPEDSTWHYTYWANNLSDDRLLLERFREVTVLQPTWMLTRDRFESIGGYIEAPLHQRLDMTHENDQNCSDDNGDNDNDNDNNREGVYKLIHPKYDTADTLRLADDLRFFHAHLMYSNNSGTLKLLRSTEPLVQYRHRIGQSQSSSTSRKLLLQLRTKAFIDTILRRDSMWLYCEEKNIGGFVIWGAGRDGKDFFKALPDDMKINVRAFVDVDEKKIKSGYYISPISTKDQAIKKKSSKCKDRSSFKIPIVHFSLLAKNDDKRRKLMNEYIHPSQNKFEEEEKGRITKGNPSTQQNLKRIKLSHNHQQIEDKSSTKQQMQPRKVHGFPKKEKEGLKLLDVLKDLPVVVCVAMYRSSGVLEKNVANIGRQEGFDLWHFS